MASLRTRRLLWCVLTAAKDDAKTMELEPDICYRAVLARDRRFDGRFFVGVRTTGIYCRPICPARTPKLENVGFYRTAAAAEVAGFRPCRRCRPETAPGTPVWAGSSATVVRALRLIAESQLADESIPALAARLGIGARQLRSLFTQHLGASPQVVVQMARLDFARRLLDQTALPVSAVAFQSGFASIRRFNAAFRGRFGTTPSALRRTGQLPADGGADGRLTLTLPYRPPLDWAGLHRFLAARAVPGLEATTSTSYRRTVLVDGASGWLEVRPSAKEAHLELTIITAAPSGLMDVVARVRRMFDLDADPLAIATHLGADPQLRSLVAGNPGLRVPGAWDPFEIAVRAVIGQQVSVPGARTLTARLVEAHGRECAAGPWPGLTRLFPTADTLSAAKLEGLGLTKVRAATLRHLAAAVQRGRLALDGAAESGELERQLLAIPGVGPWTASYIALRGFKDPDAFPASDLVLKRAVEALRGGPRQRGAPEHSERWRPWRAYAALHLWQAAASAAKESL